MYGNLLDAIIIAPAISVLAGCPFASASFFVVDKDHKRFFTFLYYFYFILKTEWRLGFLGSKEKKIKKRIRFRIAQRKF